MIVSRRVLVALLLAGGILPLGARSAAAHSKDRRPRVDTVYGLITGLAASTVRVASPTSTIGLGLTDATRYARLVTGTTADLSAGEKVVLRLNSGGSVTTVRVDARTDMPSSRRDTRNRAATPDLPTPRATKVAGKAHSRPADNPGGVVMKVTDTLIVVRDGPSRSVTYALDPDLTVKKLMTGYRTDLAIGERVWVRYTLPDTALQVTITNV